MLIWRQEALLLFCRKCQTGDSTFHQQLSSATQQLPRSASGCGKKGSDVPRVGACLFGRRFTS